MKNMLLPVKMLLVGLIVASVTAMMIYHDSTSVGETYGVIAPSFKPIIAHDSSNVYFVFIDFINQDYLRRIFTVAVDIEDFNASTRLQDPYYIISECRVHLLVPEDWEKLRQVILENNWSRCTTRYCVLAENATLSLLDYLNKTHIDTLECGAKLNIKSRYGLRDLVFVSIARADADYVIAYVPAGKRLKEISGEELLNTLENFVRSNNYTRYQFSIKYYYSLFAYVSIETKAYYAPLLKKLHITIATASLLLLCLLYWFKKIS